LINLGRGRPLPPSLTGR
jgi:hypothetical protein